MKSIFDKTTNEELIGRIKTLNEHCTAQWGKMNVIQMLKHCILAEEALLGKKKIPRMLIGRIVIGIFGKAPLKNMIKDETPVKRNMTTIPACLVKEKGDLADLASEKEKLISLLEEYAHSEKQEFEHAFFGKMTREETGHFCYKHFDHHLRQFNC